MVDPIADMLARVQNAYRAAKAQVEIPFSQIKYEMAKILEKEGFVKSVEMKGRKVRKEIEVALQYEEKVPAIAGIRRISKPGQRIYARSPEISKFKRGGGVIILSSSKGILTDKEAHKQNIGGELLCEVW